MPVDDISQVTQSLINLLKWEFFRQEEELMELDLFALPPENMAEPGLSLFLYHLEESGHHKNFAARGQGQAPVRQNPMALNLYFMLTPYYGDGDELEDVNVLDRQKDLSLAIKALHDYPEITDAVRLKKPLTDHLEPVFVPDIRNRNNRFKICLQPRSDVETIQYWTAGSKGLNLACYIKVSMVFLEPERPTRRAGRVLTYGNYVFPNHTPRITRNQNVVEFQLPNDTPSKLTIQPAQATYGDAVDYYGTGFGGDQLELQLFSANWEGAALADGWIDPSSSGNKVRVVIGNSVVLLHDGSTVQLMPGIYASQISVSKRRTLSDGNFKIFKYSSNRFPLTISPQILNISGPNGEGEVEVTGNTFPSDNSLKEEVKVYLGEVSLSPSIDDQGEGDLPPLNPGEFRILTNSNLGLRLPVPMPDSWSTGQAIPLRIIVMGAESAPNWIIVP